LATVVTSLAIALFSALLAAPASGGDCLEQLDNPAAINSAKNIVGFSVTVVLTVMMGDKPWIRYKKVIRANSGCAHYEACCEEPVNPWLNPQ
jgi:hypothetical protein